MTPLVEESTEISADPGTVWDVVMDPGRLGDWVSAHRRVLNSPEPPLSEGDSFEQTLCVAGRSFDVHWTLLEAREPELAVWSADGPKGASADVRYELSGNGGGSTRFAYRNEFQLPAGPLRVVARGVAGLPAKAAARRSLRQLKQLLER